MSNKTSFLVGIGIAMLSVALTVLLNKTWAWVLLVLGAGFVVWPFGLDYWYGKDRPDRQAIAAMAAQEYGERLTDPKFERWVKHVKIKAQVVSIQNLDQRRK